MGKQKSPLAPPAPAFIDASVLVRFDVLEVLKQKAADIVEGGRFEDDSYLDEQDRFHKRGGFWNAADPGRTADGYGKGDVEDVRRDLRKRGVDVAFEDVDAFLGELVRTERLEGATLVATFSGHLVRVPLDVDMAMPKPATPAEIRVRGMLLVEQRPDLFVIRPLVGGDLTRTHVVLVKGDALVCTCTAAQCGHVGAVREHRGGQEVLPSLAALRLSEAEHTIVVRTLLPLLVKHGLYLEPKKRNRGGQPRNAAQCALELLLRALLGPNVKTHVDALRLQRLGLIDKIAGKTTRERYRDLAEVITVLTHVRDVATRPLRARGVAIAPLSADGLRGDMIAADIVHALRLDARVTTLDTPTTITEKTA